MDPAPPGNALMSRLIKTDQHDSDTQDSGFISSILSSRVHSSAEVSGTHSEWSERDEAAGVDDSGVNIEDPDTFHWKNIYTQDENGDTMLHRILGEGDPDSTEHKQLVLRCLRATPHPDLLEIINWVGQTALHVACENEDWWSMRQLILAGAALNAVDNMRFTPLHIAVRKNDLTLIRAITKPVEAQELREIMLPHYRVIPARQPIRIPELSEVSGIGLNVVHMAVRTGNIDVLKEILPFMTGLNARELQEGRSALHLAADLQRPDMLRALLLAGAATETRDYANRTALGRLAKYRRRPPSDEALRSCIECIFVLQSHGALEPEESSDDDEDDDDDDGGDDVNDDDDDDDMDDYGDDEDEDNNFIIQGNRNFNINLNLNANNGNANNVRDRIANRGGGAGGEEDLTEWPNSENVVDAHDPQRVPCS